MPSAFDLIGHNSALQEHWVRRVIAIIIDGILVSFVAFLISLPFLWFWSSWPFYSFIIGCLWLLYAVFFDMAMGGTFGKKVLSLRVVAIDGQMDGARALIRNISKIFWVFLLLDGLLGMATPGDPRQRYLDRIARTTVTRVDQHAYIEEQFRMMQHVPPHPQAPGAAYAPPAGAPPVPQTPSQAPGQAPAQAPPAAPGGWPGQTPSPSGWPQHQWDEEGRLKPQMRFCTQCGGQLVARGDGRMTCVRCGAVY